MGPLNDPSVAIDRIEDRVSGFLAQHLDLIISGRDELRFNRPPVSVEVYREYRAGWEGWVQERHRGAVPHYLRAFEMDPGFISAGQAAYVHLKILGRRTDSARVMADSIWAILEASRDLMSPAQEWEFGFFQAVYEPDWERALEVSRGASREVPLHFAAWAGQAALFCNYLEEAVRTFERWEKGEGEYLEGQVEGWRAYWIFYADALHWSGRYEKELEVSLEGQRRFPGEFVGEMRARIALGHLEAVDSLLEMAQHDPTASPVDKANRVLDAVGVMRLHGLKEKARAVLEDELRRAEDDPPFGGHRGIVLHWLGREEEAYEEFKERIGINPNHIDYVAYLGITAALTGDTDQALDADRRLEEWPDSIPLTFPWIRSYRRAQLKVALDEVEEAVELLRQAVREGLRYHHRFLRYEVDVLRLRGHPAFDEFMRPKG